MQLINLILNLKNQAKPNNILVYQYIYIYSYSYIKINERNCNLQLSSSRLNR